MPHPNPHLDGLVALSRREGVDVRPALLRVLTDLYVQEKHHSREEEQQYVELALRLLPAVDVPTRTTVATKLSSYVLAPAAVILHLADDVPEIADLVTRHPALHESVDEMELATRDHLIDAIFQDVPGTDSDGQNAMQSSVPANTEPLSPGEIFMFADQAERTAILFELEEEAPSPPPTAPIPGREAAIGRLEAAALQRNQREFARELQHVLGLSRQASLRIAEDDSGEPILVVARALEMPSAVLLRTLLFINPVIGESVERVFSLFRLYQRVSPEAAAYLLAGWRPAQKRPVTKYVGVHAAEAAEGTMGLMQSARRAVTGAGEAPQRTQVVRTDRRQRTT
jgi:hypothetical protein